MGERARWDMPTRLEQPNEQPAGATAPPSHSDLKSVAEEELVSGRYKLVRKIGEGGMGTVWEAEHLGLRSTVAIKFLSLSVEADPSQTTELLERFRFEAQISARLATLTSNVVTVHDSGLHEGAPYLVMELARGESLEKWIDRERISAESLVTVVEQIGQALDAAHLSGIVHRDVKPGNVLCVSAPGDERRYKLADFGVAKLFDPTAIGKLTPPKQTNVHSLIGSPAYMSPEYVAGAGIIDGALDRWALGVLAYEALTRAVPFDGHDASRVLAQILRCHVAPPSTLVPTLSPAIDAFFARALAQDPNTRFPTGAAFAKAFADAARSSEPRSSSSSEPLFSGATSPGTVTLREPSMPSLGAESISSAPSVEEQEHPSQEVEALVRHDTIGGEEPSPPRKNRWTVLGVSLAVVAMVAIGATSAMKRNESVIILATTGAKSLSQAATLLLRAAPTPSEVSTPEPTPSTTPTASASANPRVRTTPPTARPRGPHTFDKSEQP